MVKFQRIVHVALLIDCDSDDTAADAVNEILREQQAAFAPGSALLDYSVSSFAPVIAFDREQYGEGDFLPLLQPRDDEGDDLGPREHCSECDCILTQYETGKCRSCSEQPD